MKRFLVCLLALTALVAQTGGSAVTVPASVTGVGQTITANLVIPLTPSSLTWACVPAVLVKGGTVSCIGTLDQPVPTGMTGTVALGPAPVGFTVTPTTVTIAAGATVTTAVVVGRQ